jgi:predicted aspartyl protease
MTRLPRLLLPFALLLPMVAGAGTQPIKRTSTGHVATQVRIDGHGEQLFGVDTGASATALYEHGRARMGLVPEEGAQIENYGVNGAQVIQRYRLPRLSVAGVEADRLLVAGLPTGIKHAEEVMGVLGRDVLGGYMVEFDLASDRLGLHRPGELPASDKGWNAVPITLMPEIGFVMLEVAIDGVPVTAVLDTGASRTFMNWRAARAAGVIPDTEGLGKATLKSGVTGHAFDYHTRRFEGIGVGATAFRPGTLSIGDLPVFVPMGMDKAPGMILGLDLMGDRRFVVDYPGLKLHIER